MLLVLHLVLLASILLLPLVVVAGTLLLAVPWIFLLLAGKVLGDRWVLPHHAVRASLCFQTWTVWACLPARVYHPFGLHPGLLFWIRLGVPGLLRLGVFGRSVTNTCNTFLGSSWMGSGLLWGLEMFLLPGWFGPLRLRSPYFLFFSWLVVPHLMGSLGAGVE